MNIGIFEAISTSPVSFSKRAFFCLLALFSFNFGAPSRSNAQTIGFIDPISSAVPADKRDGPLRDALDTVRALDGQGLRLRAEIWLKDNQVQGNFYPGAYWHDVAAGKGPAQTGYEVEQVWLLHASGTWTSKSVSFNKAIGQFEFFGAPAYAPMSPVDLVVKFRGIEQLVQVRYRYVYPRG